MSAVWLAVMVDLHYTDFSYSKSYNKSYNKSYSIFGAFRRGWRIAVWLFWDQNPISTTSVHVQMLQRLRTYCMSQGKKLPGVGGSTPLEQWSTSLEKCQNGAGGSVLGNFQLNNSYTQWFSIFYIFREKYQNSTPLEKFDPPWKKNLIFTLVWAS